MKISEHIFYIAATLMAGGAVWFQNEAAAMIFAGLWIGNAISRERAP